MFKFESLIQGVANNLPEVDRSLLEKACSFAEGLYEGRKRFSGEPFLEHSIKVLERIYPYNPDSSTIIATILLNAHDCEKFDIHVIQQEFGDDVKEMVECLAQLNSMTTRHTSSSKNVLRKMFLMMARDLRVVVIRLAERIENLQTLNFVRQMNQKEIARETMDIYVPVASRLGLYDYKLTLEDLSFKYLFPDEYLRLEQELNEYSSQFEKNIEGTKQELQSLFGENNLEVNTSARVKNLFSIYNKMKKKNYGSLKDLYDIYAMRIVIPSSTDAEKDNETLYAILSLLHAKYQPVLTRFKDYIAHPKPNGYKSLHTAVIGLTSRHKSQPTEIQIRTEKMHKIAGTGLAAHWLYKGPQGESPMSLEKEKRLLEMFANLKEDFGKSSGKLPSLQVNLYMDRIFVLTPKNLVKDLPLGSTPVDFAYAIHTDIGHACYLAKMNGAVVPLDYQLKNGDKVEIITGQGSKPKLSWLTFVKTNLAKNRIRSFFRALDKQKLFENGKSQINFFLEKLNLPFLDDQLSVLKFYLGRKHSLKERQNIIEEVGSGFYTPFHVVKGALGSTVDVLLNRQKKMEKVRREVSLPPSVEENGSGKSQRLIIGGQRNMPYRISDCCKPKLKEDILAYVTKVKGVSIHHTRCKFVKNIDPSRILPAYLEEAVTRQTRNYKVGLKLDIKERDGYLKDIVKIFNESAVVILEFQTLKKEGLQVEKRVVVDVYDQSHLKILVQKLCMVAGVMKVSKY